MVAAKHKEPDGPWYRRWTIVVPLLALLGWGVGWLVHRLTPVVDRPLEITAAGATPLAPIVLPPRNRTLVGTLQGHDGKPVNDALVSLVVADEPHWTYTGADGSFRLGGLQRGPWTVAFAAEDHLPLVVTLPDDDAPAVVRLTDAPRKLPTLPRVPLVALEGRVTAPTARSFEGFEVYFRPALPLDEIDAPLPRRALCDAGGRFTVPDLRVGAYHVIVLPEWAQNGTWPDLTRAEGEAPFEWTARAEPNASGAPTPVKLDLAITAGGVRGRVADRAGTPIEGALVLVASEADASRVWPPRTAAPDGGFELLDLPPARYVVTVRAGSGSNRSTVDVRASTIVDLGLPPLSVEQVSGR